VCEACGNERKIEKRNEIPVKRKQKKKKKSKKAKGRKANHILGLYYEEPKQPIPEEKPNFKRKKSSPPREFNKEEFVKSYFRFELLENSPNLGTNDRINWNHVISVTFKTCTPYSCPICLSPPVAARTTSCGHVFCYACLYHHFHVSDGATCPLCNETFSMDTVRIAHNQIIEKKQPGDTLKFQLLQRNGCQIAPRNDLNDKSFSRFVKVSNIKEIFDAQRVELTEALQKSVEYEPFYLSLVLQHMDTIERKLTQENEQLGSLALRSKDEKPTQSLVYQSVQGDNFFLDPLCWNMLEAQYNDPAELPDFVESRIVHLTKYILTEHNASRNRHLGHLPIGSTITAVELDMEFLVELDIYELFKPDIKERARRRKKEKKESAAMCAKIEESAKEEMDRRLLELYDRIDWDGNYQVQTVATDDLNEFPEMFQTSEKQEKSPTTQAVKTHWNVVTQKGLASTDVQELWPTLGPSAASESKSKRKTTSPELKGKKSKKKGKKKAKWRKLDLSTPI